MVFKMVFGGVPQQKFDCGGKSHMEQIRELTEKLIHEPISQAMQNLGQEMLYHVQTRRMVAKNK